MWKQVVVEGHWQLSLGNNVFDWQNMFWTTTLLHWSLLGVLSLFRVGVGSTVSRCFLRMENCVQWLYLW
jgi:hypothetical protein